MKEGDIVVHKPSGKQGVLCPTINLLTCDGDDDLSFVVYGGTPVALNAMGGRDCFEVIGEENAQADVVKCGGGRGAECCIYISVAADGMRCERHTGLRYALQFKTMTAKRDPKAPYPECQLPSTH